MKDDVSTSQGPPKMVSKPPAARGAACSRFTPTASEGTNLRALDLRLPASRTLRQHISVV